MPTLSRVETMHSLRILYLVEMNFFRYDIVEMKIMEYNVVEITSSSTWISRVGHLGGQPLPTVRRSRILGSDQWGGVESSANCCLEQRRRHRRRPG